MNPALVVCTGRVVSRPDADNHAVDASSLVHVTQALLDEGFNAQKIAQIMGGNVLLLLLETLPRQ